MTCDPSRRVFLKGAALAAVGRGLRRPRRSWCAPRKRPPRGPQGAGQGLPARRVRRAQPLRALRRPRATTRCAAGSPSRPAAEVRRTSTATSACTRRSPPLKPLYDDGRLAFVPAVGQLGLTRSHFDAQDFMETGHARRQDRRPTGWLDRAIARHPGRRGDAGGRLLVASSPRSFLGPEPVLVAQNLTSFDLRARNWRDEAERLLRAMYAGRADAGRPQRAGDLRGDQTRSCARRRSSPRRERRGRIPAGTAGTSLRQAAQLIKAGPRHALPSTSTCPAPSTPTPTSSPATTQRVHGRWAQALVAFATRPRPPDRRRGGDGDHGVRAHGRRQRLRGHGPRLRATR